MTQTTRQHKKTSSDLPTARPFLWLLLLIPLVGAGLLWYQVQAKTDVFVPKQMGAVNNCRQLPHYLGEIGFSSGAAFSTSDRTKAGLILIEQQAEGEPRIYQHPTWRSAGFLGPVLLDRNGNAYTAPAPHVDLINNLIEKQNTLYRVDTDTQQLEPFVELPVVAQPTQSNPYGVMGIAYDCDTDSLYVSSISGSTAVQELGRIYQIEVATGKVIGQLQNVDVLGLSVFNSKTEKRLYFASARTQAIRSIPLSTTGGFVGTPRYEFSLVGLGSEGVEKGRRLTFSQGADGNYELRVNGLKFNYNLSQPSSLASPSIYHFRYDTVGDSWAFANVTQ